MTAVWDILWERVTKNDISVEEMQRVISLLHEYDHGHNDVLSKLVYDMMPNFNSPNRHDRITGTNWLTSETIRGLVNEHNLRVTSAKVQLEHEKYPDEIDSSEIQDVPKIPE